jgi:ubiquitin-conjugating enzyme E2 M
MSSPKLQHSVSDINELNLPKTCNTEFPDPDDLLTFKLIICPDEVS